ncbi:MAG: hypothetical protein K8T20_17875 [Planctomycetes bacterium]|nr:hypothetical protein [Planctomycetota bacterium]
MKTTLALETIPTNPETMSLPDIEDAMGALFHVMQHHSRHCRSCCAPIIDAEGNPGNRSEACPQGVQMIEMQHALEAAYFAKPQADRMASIEAEMARDLR